jgi:clan AA aspartic protease
MGYVHATIELSNPRQPELRPVEVSALADTGALMLCIPEHLVLQLQLEQESVREVTVADGRVMRVPYVGPVRVAYQGGLALWAPWCSVMRCSLAPCPWRTWI